MFFYILNKLNYNKFRLFVIAIVLYIILHSYLYSKYVENVEFIVNYRHCIIYLFVIDMICTLTAIYFPNKKIKKKKKKIIVDEDIPIYSK